MKDEGRAKLKMAVTNSDVVAGAELVVRAYYDRSFIQSIGGHVDKHPTLAQYTKMLVDDGWPLDERSRQVVKGAYAHVSRPPGRVVSTYWEP